MSQPQQPAGGQVGNRLEALLRSAVDDQVHEQRQLSALLTEVRAMLTSQQAAGNAGVGEAAAAAVAQNQQTALAELSDGLAGLRTDVRVLPEQIARVVAAAVGAPAAAVMEELARSMESLSEHVQQRGERGLDALSGAVSGAVDTRVSSLGDLLARRLTELDDQLAEIGERQAAMAAEPVAAPALDAAEITALVERVVAGAGSESERRIIEHVDEAVLALAQAMLTRRHATIPDAGPHTPEPPAVRPEALAPPMPDAPAGPEPELIADPLGDVPYVSDLDEPEGGDAALAAADAGDAAADSDPDVDAGAPPSDVAAASVPQELVRRWATFRRS